jgi:isocitrate/isopropylmalate dehydrogenase
MSSILMLDYLGERSAARRIETALETVYREAKHTTHDVGGKAAQTIWEIIAALPLRVS